MPPIPINSNKKKEVIELFILSSPGPNPLTRHCQTRSSSLFFIPGLAHAHHRDSMRRLESKISTREWRITRNFQKPNVYLIVLDGVNHSYAVREAILFCLPRCAACSSPIGIRELRKNLSCRVVNPKRRNCARRQIELQLARNALARPRWQININHETLGGYRRTAF